MRTAVACFVLAAAIATPGIVVAAMSSGGRVATYRITSFSARSGATYPVPAAAIDPALRPATRTLIRAFKARGVDLTFFPTARGTAEGFEPGGGSCRVDIVVSARTRAPKPFFSRCPTGSIKAGAVTIVYSPALVGPTVRQAVAGLR